MKKLLNEQEGGSFLQLLSHLRDDIVHPKHLSMEPPLEKPSRKQQIVQNNNRSRAISIDMTDMASANELRRMLNRVKQQILERDPTPEPPRCQNQSAGVGATIATSAKMRKVVAIGRHQRRIRYLRKARSRSESVKSAESADVAHRAGARSGVDPR